MHKVFGLKENEVYFDREGAYLIPVRENQVGIIRTPKGYFLIGGEIESGESHFDCIKRECMEESGYTASIISKICSAETYCFHETIGFFHPIQTYYVGEMFSKKSVPTDKDHEFMWVEYSQIKGKMYFEMQNWALEVAFENNDTTKAHADA